MALTVGELRERVAKLPEEAKLYWYTEGEEVFLQAEWMFGEQADFAAERVLKFGAIQTGGPVE